MEDKKRLQFLKQKWFIHGVGGFLIAGAFTFLQIVLTGTLSLNQLFPNQVDLQVGVALFMLGYYVGVARSAKTIASYVFSGFLLGVLGLGFVLLTMGGVINWLHLFATFFMGGSGIYLGLTRPFTGGQRVDQIIKIIINLSTWIFQLGTTTISIVSIKGELVLPIIIAYIVSIIVIALLRKQVRAFLTISVEVSTQKKEIRTAKDMFQK